jgi:hypothetical protein
MKNGEDSSKIWNERTGSLLSFDDETHGRTNSEDMSLLDTTLKDLEEKSAEVVALQREINDINAALKVNNSKYVAMQCRYSGKQHQQAAKVLLTN